VVYLYSKYFWFTSCCVVVLKVLSSPLISIPLPHFLYNCNFLKESSLCAEIRSIPVLGVTSVQYFNRCCISKRHFRLGGMALSEWRRSIRAVRDTPVADYSGPSVNTTHRVAYRPPIAVSLCLLALSVSYFKQTLWRCGQVWPYVGMGSLGTRLHRDCNGWRCENVASCSFYIKLEERRNVKRYDTTRLWGSTQLRGSTKSRTERVRPKVGKDRVWIFIVW